MARKGQGRKSVGPDVNEDSHFELLNTVRVRTQKMLKATANSIAKLTADDSLSALRIWKEDLNVKWSDHFVAFEEHEAAMVSTGDGGLDAMSHEFTQSHNAYLKAKIHVTQLISDLTTPQHQSTDQDTNENSSQPRIPFKLAPMRITHFSGDLTDWIEFLATCKEVLTARIPEVQRLQVLKDALFGEARTLVSHILPGPGAFNSAMNLLKERYDNQRAIINAHLRALYSMPSMEAPTANAFRTMLNTINGLVAALGCCEIETASWDAILVFHVSQRFDKQTLALWEDKLEGKRTVPKLKTLLTFIEVRITVLETTEAFSAQQSKTNAKPQTQQKFFDGKKGNDKFKSFYTLKPSYKCVLCSKNHLASRCDEISRMSLRDRQRLIAKNNLCINCFYPHEVKNCPFESACKKCSESHHTLLHHDGKQVFLNVTDEKCIGDNASTSSNHNSDELRDNDILSQISGEHFYHLSDHSDEDTLLATAIVPTRSNGRSSLLYALIDQGSTANLITDRACNLLKLQFTRINSPMFGVGNSPVGSVIGRTLLEIGSIHNPQYKLTIKAIVVRSIGNTNGFDKARIQEWSHLHNLPLANPKYFEAHKIDLLLGGSAHADFILDEVKKGQRDQPIAQHSKLGWFISGTLNVPTKCIDICRNTKFEVFDNPDNDLSAQLRSFWELEEVECKRFLTPEEQTAEEIFKKSVTRTKNGNLMVDLPFKLNPYENLGDSLSMAKRRYRCLERKFERDPQLKIKYDAVLEEYLELNHMELVTDSPIFQCFLPHHAVIKESSSTTKVRTVFDGSAKTSTGISLNECLCVGPVIQPELFDLLLEWRKYEFVISGDIEKMYRMIRINPEHANLHSILWNRPGTNGAAVYRLLTVTFGTSAAPFQATRSVYEIALRIKDSQPELANAIQNNFYVDDFFKSFPSIQLAIETRQGITDTLAEYGLNLRKWKSNHPQILIGVDDIDLEPCINFNSVFKTLGLAWHADSDAFIFKSLEFDDVSTWTKRRILSAISKLFDPLGWMAPCIVRAKVLMQDIWRLPNHNSWDSELPKHIVSQWVKMFAELNSPMPIKVPRWLKLSNRNETVEIHAFSDAATIAYACGVYVRVFHENNVISCNLIASKTKVAPIKATTIPRLELCGAVLLSKLVVRCIHALSLSECQVFAWCDSKIVLAWLATHPSKWVTFVANRVSEIQQNIDASHWRYIPSKQNPADIASRGCSISELESSSMWWHGPSFLTNNVSTVPKQDFELPIETAPEKRKQIKSFHVNVVKQNHVLDGFEDFTRLLRFTCIALRWLTKMKTKKMTMQPISASEIEAAEMHWVKFIQNQHFGEDIGRIKNKRSLTKASNLHSLAPFIDDGGLLRMNGRVGNADFLSQKTALILPANSKFVLLLVRYTHQHQVLHGGVQLTLRALRERFWIIHARNQVKKLIGHCVVCYRNKKQLLKQQMAELPSFRTEQAKPFTFVGCDYAGPFTIKLNDNKNAKTTKGYIALFICLTTKAIHLEVACDLSTAEFIMVLENFIARRGIPSVIHSDNGTNFVGTEKEIHELLEQMLSQTNALTRMLANNRITFKRIPARASHMAGIWERAVGLVKYHLKRVLNGTKLTARRFDHVLKQIECCLNSRPLWALTPNSDDIEVITPSHFFNFQAINTLPRPDLSHIKMNRLDQYQFLYRLYTDFWKGWSKEYIDQLQTRQKWSKEETNIKVGQIVVISEDNLPPSRWPLGRISAVYPAKDGLIRIVDVKCGNTTLKRPIHRLGILPILDNERLNCSGSEKSNARENVDAFSTF